MPVITSIKQQKAKNRVNVYLDDKFGFGIDLDNLVILKIKIGNEYSQEQIEELIKKAEYQKTLDKLLRFASMRPRSEKEVERWFQKKDVHKSLWDELKERLKYFELLNDTKFAKWWVDQRQAFRPKSKRVLIGELRLKGISSEIINNLFEDTKIDEVKMAQDLISKKMYKWEKLDSKLKKQKMTQYLAQKGFGWNVIEQVLPKMLK